MAILEDFQQIAALGGGELGQSVIARIRSLRRQVSLAVDIPEASEGGRAWVGMRPIVPDSLPVIGKLPSRENAYVNTGHQMLGITLAPSSACALAGLMLEGKAGVGLEAFSARRF